jgi:hypothetical protein
MMLPMSESIRHEQMLPMTAPAIGSGEAFACSNANAGLFQIGVLAEPPV